MLAQFIQKMRKDKGLTQEYMASALTMSRPTYMQIEQGEREITVSEARKLADLFELSLDDFLAEKAVKMPTIKIEKVAEKKKEQPEMRISVPQKNARKFKEVLLYILERIGALPNIGEAVICKLLYFIDFDYYEKHEEQLIGATYIKNHHGPTPAEFTEIVKEMEEKGDLVKVNQKYFQYEQKKYLPRRKPDLTFFTALEMNLIDTEIARFKDKNAKEMEEISHRDIPWIGAENLKPIDYEAVFYRTPEFSVRKYDDEI